MPVTRRTLTSCTFFREKRFQPSSYGLQSLVTLPSSGKVCDTFTRYKNGHRLLRKYRTNGGEGTLYWGIGMLSASPRAPCGTCVACAVSAIWENKRWAGWLIAQRLGFLMHRAGPGCLRISQTFQEAEGNETVGTKSAWRRSPEVAGDFSIPIRKSSDLLVAHEPSPGTKSPAA